MLLNFFLVGLACQNFALAAKNYDHLAKEISLKYSVEKKILIVNFWASWCKPCLKEFKSLGTFYDKQKEKIEVTAFCTDEEDAEGKIKKIKKKYNLNFKFINDEKSVWADKFDVETLPRTFIFKDGKQIMDFSEETDFSSEEFLKKIEKYLL